MTLQMPGESRKAVRNALRKHARCAEVLTHYSVAYVNNLTNEQLLGACAILQIDAAAIVASMTGATVIVSDPYASLTAAPVIEPATQEADMIDVPPAPEPDDIAAEATAIRRELASAMVEGNFDAVTARLSGLLTDARKPAEVITVNHDGAAPTHIARPVSRSTWGALFGVTGQHASRPCQVWDSPEAPKIDPMYRWPEAATVSALCALGRKRHPWFFGPPGTGKTTWAEQLAARLGRPFRTISCDDTTEAPELIGMRGPHDGRTVWLDGILASALRIPGCVILIDEPTIARAGAVMVMQSILQNRYLFVKETGEKIVAAPGVMFIAADNTNGTGGGAASGFEDTRRMNAAFLDRFAVKLRIDYMPADVEAAVMTDRTGCTLELANLLVTTATVTRAHAADGKLNGALGLRRLVAWAEQLTDGIAPRIAFENCILNGAPEEDRETLEQLCLLAFDPAQIAPALAGQQIAAPVPGTTPRDRDAQAQFAGA
jgi:cobaltochelatase CobS